MILHRTWYFYSWHWFMIIHLTLCSNLWLLSHMVNLLFVVTLYVYLSHMVLSLLLWHLFTSHDHMVHPLLRVTYDYLSHKILSLFAVTLYVHISHMVLSLFAVTYNYLLHMVFPLIAMIHDYLWFILLATHLTLTFTVLDSVCFHSSSDFLIQPLSAVINYSLIAVTYYFNHLQALRLYVQLLHPFLYYIY